MIAVCLLTCGRVTMTARTASAFVEFNRGRKDMVLLHCDGLPFADRDAYHARCIAKAHGFITIGAPGYRVSQMSSLATFMTEVGLLGAEFVLWLENDWVSVAPVPKLEFFQKTREGLGVVTWRLFGERKMKGDGPRAMAGTHLIGTRTPIDWDMSGIKGWRFGHAHWAAGGSVVLTDHLAKHLGCERLKDVIVAEPGLRSMRPTKNIMFSIGYETTPGFVG